MNVASFGKVFAALLAASALQAAGQPAAVLSENDEKTLANGKVEFQRGVFRVEPDGSQISLLCIQVGPRWEHVGSERDCGDPPPRSLMREITRFPDDMTFLGIRNLGIDTGQWQSLRQNSAAGSPTIRRIGEAFSYSASESDVRWRFVSAKLPSELKTPIPGAAIAMHFGQNFSETRRPKLFAPGSTALVEATFALPRATMKGAAHTGVTIAVDMDVPTVAGSHAVLTLIVNVFHPEGKSREAIRSDGRVNYGSAPLERGSRYIQLVANQRRSSPWPNPERFAFRLTRETVRNLIADANGKPTPGGKAKDPLDVSRIDDVRLSSLTLRNENRFLERGDVDVEVVVDSLRMIRDKSR